MRLTGDDRGGSRRFRPAVLAALGLILAGPGGPPVPARSEPGATQVTVLGLRGYDPVSYFLPEGPQPGSARFEEPWGGRIWRFASEANRAVFQRDPDIYAPRLGGFDAAGILDRRLVDADPAVFAILGERLYLFRNGERRGRFLAEPALAGSAEAIWPGLRSLLDDPGETGAGPDGGTARPAEGPPARGRLRDEPR
jgi:hypothetical protein